MGLTYCRGFHVHALLRNSSRARDRTVFAVTTNYRIPFLILILLLLQQLLLHRVQPDKNMDKIGNIHLQEKFCNVHWTDAVNYYMEAYFHLPPIYKSQSFYPLKPIPLSPVSKRNNNQETYVICTQETNDLNG